MEIAEGCFRHIEKIFTELEEIRGFELLRTSYDRANYLLTKEAKIIAMTCTHAALKVSYYIIRMLYLLLVLIYLLLVIATRIGFFGI